MARSRRDSITGYQVNSEDAKPKSRKERIKEKMHAYFCCGKDSSDHRLDQELGGLQKIYKVKSEGSVYKPSLLIKYLNWSFETSFLFYLISAMAIYLFLIAFFAFLTILSVTKGAFKESVDEGDTCFHNLITGDDIYDLYASAFTLSWTTFSTVGYGHIYPKVTASCGLSNFSAALTSFFGVLYAGFAGAIVFGKVLCVHSHAPVIFSDICVIRYGTGITEDPIMGGPRQSMINGPRQSTITKRNDGTTVCPVLIFRIVNEKAKYKYGNILNLSLDVVSVVVNETFHYNGSRMHRQFRNLNIQPESVPIFEDVLMIRHVLNADSPLIDNETRKMIQSNNGRWPESYDSYEKIRDTLNFSEINISVQGVSCISKSTVYAQKVYALDEVKVGYKFIDMTYANKDSSKGPLVDLDMINYVKEQVGGGSEPLNLH